MAMYSNLIFLFNYGRRADNFHSPPTLCLLFSIQKNTITPSSSTASYQLQPANYVQKERSPGHLPGLRLVQGSEGCARVLHAASGGGWFRQDLRGREQRGVLRGIHSPDRWRLRDAKACAEKPAALAAGASDRKGCVENPQSKAPEHSVSAQPSAPASKSNLFRDVVPPSPYNPRNRGLLSRCGLLQFPNLPTSTPNFAPTPETQQCTAGELAVDRR
jgi:hypothetical protein